MTRLKEMRGFLRCSRREAKKFCRIGDMRSKALRKKYLKIKTTVFK